MKSSKGLQMLGMAVGICLGLYVVYTHLEYFGDISFLGGILLLEVLIVGLWKYENRFFILLMVAFVWAGMRVPLQGSWTVGRWLVLSAGAVVGYVVWAKNMRRPFGTMHLVAFFCVSAAFVSATVSPFVQMASFKAISLVLLFLYCSGGARATVIGREQQFFRGLLVGCEFTVYATAICYLVLGQSVWGNPNSLGAAMSIGLFPILLWGWLNAEGPVLKFRLLIALLLCLYLVFFSMARAGMVSVTITALIFCFCLKQYKLLTKVVAMTLFVVAVTGMLSPPTLETSIVGVRDAVLYKGHKDEGMFGSRKSPWEKSIAIIKEHPLFGTGYGTSPTGEDPGLNFGTMASSSESSREHGSSYITIAEWVGLLGVLPFACLIGLTAANAWRVCVRMRQTGNSSLYSIPLAMVVLSGLIHAGFEDWLFAVGAYPCVYFWVCSFVLADRVSMESEVPMLALPSRRPPLVSVGFEDTVPSPVAAHPVVANR